VLYRRLCSGSSIVLVVRALALLILTLLFAFYVTRAVHMCCAATLQCTFSDHAVAETGGALFTTTGSVCTVLASTFTNNTATGSDSKGGAASVAGTASFSGCSFTGSSAESVGGAVYGDATSSVTINATQFDSNQAGTAGGSVFTLSRVRAVITDSSFSNSSASCCYANAAAHASTVSCVDVDSSSSIGRGSECCSSDYYINAGRCVQCSYELACASVGTNTATLQLAAGLWRPRLEDTTVFECYNTDACKGGVALTSSAQYCTAGYTGPCKCIMLYHNVQL
jgi:hypothetical protein